MMQEHLSPVFEAFLRNGAGMFVAARLAPTEQEHANVYYRFMSPAKGAVIVDLGCGSGQCGALLKEIDPSLEVINVVNDSALIDYMNGKGRLCVNASFEDVPLPSKIADFVLCNEAIGHGDLDKVFQEAHRLLKDGGVMVIKDFSITDTAKETLDLSSWQYQARQPSEFVAAAYRNGLSVQTLLHPPMYMRHWFDIMESEQSVVASAALHDPKDLPLCMSLYRLIKGPLHGKSVN